MHIPFMSQQHNRTATTPQVVANQYKLSISSTASEGKALPMRHGKDPVFPQAGTWAHRALSHHGLSRT